MLVTNHGHFITEHTY